MVDCVFAADAPAPRVARDQYLLVADAQGDIPAQARDALRWLRPAGLDTARGPRGLGVAALPEMPAVANCALTIFAPITDYLLP